MIGIDLGTTFSCVAIFENGRAEVKADQEGNRTTPSVVSFTETDRLVGKPAKSRSSKNAKNTIFAAKRLIGRRFNDPEVQQEIPLLPFRVIEENGNPIIEVMYKTNLRKFTPEEISAYILQKMKQTAEMCLDEVKGAVITVPAYFNDGQRRATKDAATIAGFENVKMINEPTAAAIAYGLENVTEEPKIVLIFDLGGGTFDVTIVKISQNLKFEVVATKGDTKLGGDDFDSMLLKHFAEEFKAKKSQNVFENPIAMSRLRVECERIKRELSTSAEEIIEIDNLMNHIDFASKITRTKFEQLCGDLFRRTIETVSLAIEDANLEKTDIDDIVLVGGSTRIPKIRSMLQELFPDKKLRSSVNPDEVVACGAALYAAKSFGAVDTAITELQLSDVTPLSLGVFVLGDVMRTIIKRNTPIPTKATKFFTTCEDNQTVVNICVYEGERAIASENHKLGQFTLTGIPPLPRGVSEHTCTMEIDSDGILVVTAVVIDNGNRSSITISNDSGRLTRSEIDRMIRVAKQFEAVDRDHLIRAKVKNELEDYAYSIRDALQKYGHRLTADEFRIASNAWRETINWSKSPNLARIQTTKLKHKSLEEVCSPILSKLE